MTTLTQVEVAAIREAAQRATPGPWVFAEDARPRPKITTIAWCGDYVIGLASDYEGGNYRDGDPCGAIKDDAAHIANLSPERVLALVEAYEVLRELVERKVLADRREQWPRDDRGKVIDFPAFVANLDEHKRRYPLAMARARALFADKEG